MDRAYDGVEKLVLCLDVGTTQSAAAIVHLQPGAVPKLRVVSRWPGANSSKIPSLLYYSSSGEAKAFGAEALEEGVVARAEAEKWEKCIHFKLWLHTAEMAAPPAYVPEPVEAESAATVRSGLTNMHLGRALMSGIREARGLGRGGGKSFELAPLPAGVKIEKVYRDWMGYLYQSAKAWWCEVNPDGGVIWEKLEGEMVFCLAHPNGWELSQQGLLRTALSQAVHKPQLANESGTERVVFVTEGEASVHFGLHYTAAASLDSWLRVGAQLAVVDGGGSTVDTTIYSVDETTPKLKLREVKPSACVQAGAIFPTRDARTLIGAKLKKSKYGAAEYLNEILSQFDTKTKHNFVDESDLDHMIKFGFDRDNDKACGISRGRLSLKGTEVNQAFKPSMDLILESVGEQLEGTSVKTILLSGGFGESPHVQRRLRQRFEASGIKVITSDEPSKKAVAEGAALFYVRDAVVARASRYTFGTNVGKLVEVWPEHLLNVGEYCTYEDLDGLRYQNGGWNAILMKGDVLESEQVVSSSFFVDRASDFSHTAEIWVTDSDEIKKDDFMIDEKGKIRSVFKHICDVKSDLTPLKTESHKRELWNDGGSVSYYWRLRYNIELLFGGTSLKARLSWDENGIERIGQATIIPSIYY